MTKNIKRYSRFSKNKKGSDNVLNQFVLVGRLHEEVKEKNKKGFAIITLGVPRSYKDENGEYQTDFIDIKISGKNDIN